MARCERITTLPPCAGYLIKKKLDNNREHPGHVSKEQRVSHSQLNGHPKQSALIICSTNTPYIARAV